MELMRELVIVGCLIVFRESLVEYDTIKVITKIGAKMLATIINEESLPLAIQKDIKALKAYHKGELNDPEDCLYMELYASINGSQHGGEITKEVADYLRAKYLGIGNVCEYVFMGSRA